MASGRITREQPPGVEVPVGAQDPYTRRGGFEVRLENFTGPFDLLLGLISKHQLDITEIALARVTDEFIGYIRGLQELGREWALDEASEFLVIAATLLDLKAARLLPSGRVEDEEDIALLEARDLLFARLLQYKAFKEVAGLLGERLASEEDRYPRQVSLEPGFATLLPDLIWKTGLEEFAALARKALEPRQPVPTEVGLSHLHAPPVSIREQAGLMAAMLQGRGPLSFRQLIAGPGGPGGSSTDGTSAEGVSVVVARFLALLEMFRDAVVVFDQSVPLGDLTVSWIGSKVSWTGKEGW